MRSRYLFVAAFAAAVLLSPIRDVEACGPFFEPEVFVRNTIPTTSQPSRKASSVSSRPASTLTNMLSLFAT